MPVMKFMEQMVEDISSFDLQMDDHPNKYPISHGDMIVHFALSIRTSVKMKINFLIMKSECETETTQTSHNNKKVETLDVNIQ